MSQSSGPQTFELQISQKPSRILWQIAVGIGGWVFMAVICVPLLGQLGPIGRSPVIVAITVLLTLGGIVLVPLIIILRVFLQPRTTITLDTDTGLTVKRRSLRGEEFRTYEWASISGIEIVGTSSARGMLITHTLHVYTSDGEQLSVPQSMGSFDYFLDLLNRSATHLPYSWVKNNNDYVRTARA